MDYTEVYEKLEERALKFHQVLSQNGVYTDEVSEAEFLQRTQDTLKERGRNIVEKIGDPWVTVLALPEDLVDDLSDKVYTTEYDTMDGAAECFNAMKNLLNQARFDFSWSFDKEQKKLEFRVDEISWSVPCESLAWIDEPLSESQIDPKLYNFLKTHGLEFYPVTTGDTVARFMLLPVSAVDAVKDYLIHDFDERAMWFFEGIPESEKPSDLWSL